MPKTAITQMAVIGIDIGKNLFHVVGLDRRVAIVLRQKWSCGQVGERLARTRRPVSSGWKLASARII